MDLKQLLNQTTIDSSREDAGVDAELKSEQDI